MTKWELADLISTEFEGISLHKAEKIINFSIDIITNVVKKGKPVKIAGLGTFTLKKVKSRAGSNPRTKERITIPAYKTVKFKASDTLKKAVK